MVDDLDDATVDTLFGALTAEPDLVQLAAAARATAVPILTGMQAQGDILVRPTAAVMPYYAQPERDGAVIALIAEGNGHRLRIDLSGGGRVRWCGRVSGTDLGLLEVTGGAVVYVEQVKGADAHAPLGVGPGVYLVGRQRQLGSPPRWVLPDVSRWLAQIARLYRRRRNR